MIRAQLKFTRFVSLLAVMSITIVLAGPNRYGHSDRVERHMLPAVTTGPLDPAWIHSC